MTRLLETPPPDHGSPYLDSVCILVSTYSKKTSSLFQSCVAWCAGVMVHCTKNRLNTFSVITCKLWIRMYQTRGSKSIILWTDPFLKNQRRSKLLNSSYLKFHRWKSQYLGNRVVFLAKTAIRSVCKSYAGCGTYQSCNCKVSIIEGSFAVEVLL